MEHAFRQAAAEFLKSQTGIVTAVNGNKVSVKPLERRSGLGFEEPLEGPTVQDVPIKWPMTGNGIVYFPVKVGDKGMIHWLTHGDGDELPHSQDACVFYPASEEAFNVAWERGSFCIGTPTAGITIFPDGRIRIHSPYPLELATVGGFNTASCGEGSTYSMVGTVNVTDDVFAADVSLRHHTHGGVQSGGDDTGEPNG